MPYTGIFKGFAHPNYFWS